MGATDELPYDTPRLHRLAAATGQLEALDAPAKRVASVVRSLLPGGPVKDALSGTLLGHPAHPLLTDVPIGSWTSAVMLDWIGGSDSRTAARRLRGRGNTRGGADRGGGLLRLGGHRDVERHRAPDRPGPRRGQHRRARHVQRVLPGPAPRR